MLSVFVIIISINLLAKLVVRGSMAYLLSTRVSRVQIVITQITVLISGLFIVHLITFLAGFIVANLSIDSANTIAFLEFFQINFFVFFFFFAFFIYLFFLFSFFFFVFHLITFLDGFIVANLSIDSANTIAFLEFFQINFVGFLLFVAIGSYSLLISALFNDERNAFALALGITFIFYALDMVGK